MMFRKNRHTSDSGNWIIHPLDNKQEAWGMPPASPSKIKTGSIPLRCIPQALALFWPPWYMKRLSSLKHYIKKSCFYMDPNPGRLKNNKAGLTAIVVRIPSLLLEGDPFVSWSPRETAGSLQSNETTLNLEWSNTQPSSCASDGSPEFTAHKRKQSALSSIWIINSKKTKNTLIRCNS